MPTSREHVTLSIAGRDVAISNPSKVLFPEAGITKLDVVRYYLAVAEGALRGAGGRPNVLVRYANGIDERVLLPEARADEPPALDRGRARSPSRPVARRTRSCRATRATLAWMANLACLELHPHPVRADDLEHPDELRVDLDPVPGVEWRQIVEVAGVVRDAPARLSIWSAGRRRRARAACT